MNDCPRTGKLGACTKSALASFQRKYGISGEDGIAGPKTIGELNQLFSAKVM
jgi:peptidoglycan hydrolase-like protein with peptidoglycan-binding domain